MKLGTEPISHPVDTKSKQFSKNDDSSLDYDVIFTSFKTAFALKSLFLFNFTEFECHKLFELFNGSL